MLFVVYFLFSQIKSKYYIGYTSNLNERLARHNQKGKGFTGSVNDWVIVYTETFHTKEFALLREKQIKSWKSKIKIQDLIYNKD